MGIIKFMFGFDKSDVTAFQVSQKIDAEQFEKVFGALKKWQEAQNIDAKQFEEVFGALKEWQEAQKIDVEQFEKVFSALEEKVGIEQFQSMQDHLSNLSKTVEVHSNTLKDLTGAVGDHGNTLKDLTEAVGGQEQAIIICTIATAVAVTAIASFVAFCIYQGVKLEKEGKNDLSQGTPNGKFNNVSDTERLKNNLQEGRV